MAPVSRFNDEHFVCDGSARGRNGTVRRRSASLDKPEAAVRGGAVAVSYVDFGAPG